MDKAHREAMDTLTRAVSGLISLSLFFMLLLPQQAVKAEEWTPLTKDGVHDPENEAVKLLQQPAEAFSVLPKDSAGNKVDWVGALRDGYIKPRHHLSVPTEVKILESEILLKDTGEMPFVKFPHRPHTEWLACKNCHDSLFPAKAGATKLNMLDILEGKYCGKCHGAVAFPLTECDRCHSVPNNFN